MASTKNVQIIARVEFKNDSNKVCYRVRSSNGHDEYTTCLFNGKACSCTCPSRKPCYHMNQVEALEAARQPVQPAPAPVAASIATKGTLNNRNCGFSMMR